MITLSRHKLLAVPFTLFLFAPLMNGVSNDSPKAANNRPGERRLQIDQTQIPGNVIKVTSVQNLQSERFPEGFEVTVKNVSDKSIYCIYFHVLFEESKPMYGTKIMFSLTYGAPRLVPTRALAKEGDVPLRPGESAVLELNPLHVEGIMKQVAKNSAFATLGRSFVRLAMQHINFGDGTGYVPGGFYPGPARSSVEDMPGGFYPLSRSGREEFAGFQAQKDAPNLGYFASSSNFVYINFSKKFPCTTCAPGTLQLVPMGCSGGCDYYSWHRLCCTNIDPLL